MKQLISKVQNIFKNHPERFYLIGLFIFCYIFLFHNLGSYPLIDVDETRYASMAREILQKSDWITMHLNYDIFYEKPPLYFWLLALSYKFFGNI